MSCRQVHFTHWGYSDVYQTIIRICLPKCVVLLLVVIFRSQYIIFSTTFKDGKSSNQYNQTMYVIFNWGIFSPDSFVFLRFTSGWISSENSRTETSCEKQGKSFSTSEYQQSDCWLIYCISSEQKWSPYNKTSFMTMNSICIVWFKMGLRNKSSRHPKLTFSFVLEL